MLAYFFIKQRWANYFKNSFYLDYGLKFWLKSVVYSFLIQTAYFFAEKYVIEYYTRFVFNYLSYSTYKIAFSLSNNKLAVVTVFAVINVIIAIL